jgi:hypothetical protein
MIGDFLIAMLFLSVVFTGFLMLYGICGVVYYKLIKKSKLTVGQILSIL